MEEIFNIIDDYRKELKQNAKELTDTDKVRDCWTGIIVLDNLKTKIKKKI